MPRSSFPPPLMLCSREEAGVFAGRRSGVRVAECACACARRRQSNCARGVSREGERSRTGCRRVAVGEAASGRPHHGGNRAGAGTALVSSPVVLLSATRRSCLLVAGLAHSPRRQAARIPSPLSSGLIGLDLVGDVDLGPARDGRLGFPARASAA